MQYLLIISHDDSFTPNETLLHDIGTWIKEMERRGVRVYGNPLRPAGDATTVRVRKGKVVLKKGPFANSDYVTWTLEGPVPYFMKIAHWFFNMDRMVGGDFEAGLASLKTLAEK